MADFLRPEVKTTLWRWREILAAGAVAALGLWWGLQSFGVLQWLGWALAGAGIGLGLAGAQRLRFARGGGGPGVVKVTEGRVTYMGPFHGGVAELDRLMTLDLDPCAPGAPCWVLTLEDGSGLSVPVNAEGADTLFDLFALLPGLRTERMLRLLRQDPATRVRVWSRTHLVTPPSHRLH